MKGIKKSVYIERVKTFNQEFYAKTTPNNRIYRSLDGDNWTEVLKGQTVLDAASNAKVILFAIKKNNSVCVVDSLNKQICSIPITQDIDSLFFRYCKEIKKFYICGHFSNNVRFLYFIPESIQVGSGITNLEANDDRLVAKFGNGLQIAAYDDNNNKPDFAGKEWSFSSGQNKLTIGKWF